MEDLILSIIIPVYNTYIYLDKCVESIINQISSGVEIILVDDGSTDESGIKCDEYSNKYSYIVAVHKENGGLASARNAGISVAKGKYINFLDSDDWLSDGAIDQILNIIDREEPDIIGFGCQKTTGTVVFKKSTQRWEEGLHKNESINKIRNDIINDKELFEFNVIRSSCMHVFKKSIIDKLNLRFISERIVLNEDYLFVTSFILEANNYYCCKKYFYNYFNRENSLTTTYLTNMFERKLELFARYNEMINNISEKNEELLYRLKLFYLNNCYECLANECAAIKPDKKKIQVILDDIDKKDVIKYVRKNEQSRKAKFFLFLMKRNNASEYIFFYKVFGIIKKIKWNLRKKRIGIICI